MCSVVVNCKFRDIQTEMVLFCKILKFRLLLVLVIINIILAVYWIIRLRWMPDPHFQKIVFKTTTYEGESLKTANTSKINNSDYLTVESEQSIEVIRTEFLTRPTHEDLFTEFDDEVLNGLYGDDEYMHDLRYDRHRGVDEGTIANAKYSTMRLMTHKSHYNVNDVVFVSIVLQDGFNKRILHGGDIVRVWIKDVYKGACANGYVLDHRNGSFTGVVRLLWPGHVEIVAGVAATREAVRVLYTIHREGYLVRQIFAIFQRRFTYEMILCAYTPHLPYDRVCNLTEMNYGLPWYCGHPDFLTCAEWTKTGASQPPWPLYTEDRTLFDADYAHQNIRKSKRVRVRVVGELDSDSDSRGLLPCNELPPVATWQQTTPVGYFLKWNWRSTICTNVLPNTVKSWHKCLSHRRIWMHGDSTLRQWFKYFKRRQNVSLVTEKWQYDQWPYPSILYSKQYDYAIYWATHELPFTNTEQFVLRLAHKAIHVYIDEIPSSSRDIVIIHLYLHFSAYPPTVVRTHLRRIVQSVKSLLQRAPAVKVFLKGPHAFHDNGNRGVIDDYWGTIYSQIYKQEFEDVQEKVYYLDYWDMTVAAENVDVHPNATLYEAQIQTLLGYICP